MQGNWASDIDQRPQYGRDNQTGNASGMDANRDSRYSTSHGSHHAFAYANHPYQPGQTQSGGRAPKGYSRSDERIREDICERLMSHPYADASEVTISVKEGLVTLEGKVVDRPIKYEIENVAESCLGVKDVENRIRVDAQSGQSGSQREMQASPQARPGKRESA
jgi:Predicted periplasmic or secreted lipoprotein